MSSAICFNLDQSKILLYVNGLTHYKTTNFIDSSKLKELADDNFKFHENGTKLSKRVENTVGKGEIAHYEQFLFPQCFQKACFRGASKGVIVWKWVKKRYSDTMFNMCALTWKAIFAFSCMPNISGSSIKGKLSIYCLYSSRVLHCGA